MATNEELEQRIEELERKAEHTARRFMEVEDTPVYQMALINELKKKLAQSNEKHNALCDIVDRLCLYAVPSNLEVPYSVDNARIPTGDKEAQDEGVDIWPEIEQAIDARVGDIIHDVERGRWDWENRDRLDDLKAFIKERFEVQRLCTQEAQDETASDNARVENNTVGNTLRSNDLVCDGDTFDAQLEALRDTFSEILRLKYGGSVEGRYEPVTELLNALRPHLEQWAHKVAEAEAKLMGIDLVVSGCVAPEIVDKRLDCAAYRNACELRKERDALKAEVEKLKRPCSCGGEGKLYGEDEDVWVYCGCRIGKDMHTKQLQADLEKAWESELDAKAEVARLREALRRIQDKCYDVDHDTAELCWNIAKDALAESEDE